MGYLLITCNNFRNRKRHDFMQEVSPNERRDLRFSPDSAVLHLSSSSLLSHLRRFPDGATPSPLLFDATAGDAACTAWSDGNVAWKRH